MILDLKRLIMNKLNYRNFDLRIWRTEDIYYAQVQSEDTGESSGNFNLPFLPGELKDLLSTFDPREDQAKALEAAKVLGGILYNAVFAQHIGIFLGRNKDLASQNGDGLRIRLRLNAVSELASLPWEFLYDETRKSFLVFSYKTSLVRYLEISEKSSVLTVKPPLRILVMIPSPKESLPLNVKSEWQKLQKAFKQLPKGLIEIERLKTATFSDLRKRLNQGPPCHILHFIGHGGIPSGTRENALVMEDKNRTTSFVNGNQLGTLLQNHPSLRLVFLNACDGAAATPNDVFSGVAQSLIRYEIPAVIAMQFKISDSAAIAFTGGFYEALAQGNPVDAAMLNARLAIFTEKNSVEWGTPVLYLRAPDGRIFDADLREFESRIVQHPETIDSGKQPEAQQPQLQITLPDAAPSGTLSPQSSFYIERSAETKALKLVQGKEITLLIIKLGQSGGSSLINRLLDVAGQSGKRTVYLNFQRFDSNDFEDAERFYHRFCVALTRALKIEGQIREVSEYWQDYSGVGIGERCTYYLEYLLQQLGNQSLFLAMDEIDRLAGTKFKSDFFAMVRNWHNERAMESNFKRLDLMLITSLERHQLIDDPNQSPFNVGVDKPFSDFDQEEVTQLSARYGLSLNSNQIQALMSFLGGHPYLYQLAFHHLATSQIDTANIEKFIQQAKTANSPFRSHLDSLYVRVRGTRMLLEGVTQVLRNRELDEEIILQLRRAGLIKRQTNKVLFRCRLYEEFFREHFPS
jgi:CHAT domain-containing protein